ncbi:30S ribosome-binding factor RbfA [Chloroflexota bacterium]
MAHRIERVNSLIRQEISELLQQQVKDPRLGNSFISVTEVVTSTDMKYSRVYVSSITTEEEKQKVLKALSSASSFLRRELSRRLKLRYTPELIFQWDNSLERGDHILKLIDELSPERDY